MYAWTRHDRETLTLKAGQYKYTGTTPLMQYLLLPRSLPTMAHTPYLLGYSIVSAHKRGADELTQEEGSTAYTHTRLINESSAQH